MSTTEVRVMVRFAPEINTKSPRVKSRFVRRLVRNVEAAMASAGIGCEVESEWSCLMIRLESEAGLAVLQRVFGVGWIFPVEARSSVDEAAMEKTIRDVFGPQAKAKSICVRVRKDKSLTQLSASGLERHLGGVLAGFGAGVNLSTPDLKVSIHLGPKEVLYFCRALKGPDGLPLGSQGRALMLLSGGFDSAVAAWMIMRRGVELDFCLFNLAGREYEQEVHEVAQLLLSLWGHGMDSKFGVCDFSAVSAAIKTKIKPKYAQLTLKRAFYKCADALTKDNPDYCGFVTGEAVGQVSTQTLKNLQAVDDATTCLVLRPLICAEKDEIIQQARQIGTHDACSRIKEYCGISKERPVTRSQLSEARKMDQEALAEVDWHGVLQAANWVKLGRSNHEAAKDLPQREESLCVSVEEIPPGAVVIDTRPVDQFNHWHYPGATRVDFEALDQYPWDLSQTYLLYCPIGLETAVVCERLHQQGVKAFSFKGGATKLRKLYDPGW